MNPELGQKLKALDAFKDWTNYLLVTTVAALGWAARKDAKNGDDTTNLSPYAIRALVQNLILEFAFYSPRMVRYVCRT
jgi:hypothetical protein